MVEAFQENPTIVLAVHTHGGMDSDTPRDQLLGKSHALVQGQWQQRPGVGLSYEYAQNTDYSPNGIGKRLGGVELEDFSATLVTDDEPLQHVWFTNAGNSSSWIVVGKKSIYTNQSGSWAVMKGPDGSTDFAWETDITRVSVPQVDGRLMICGDEGYILPYRTGASLDDQLHYNSVSTTVDSDSNSGQKVLNVLSTTGFSRWDRVIIGEGTAREESGYVDSVQSGTSVTLFADLSNTHTSAQGDTVEIQNQYTTLFDSSTKDITGAWTSGAYIATEFQNRLVYSSGNSLIEWTPVANEANSGIWNVGDGANKFDIQKAPVRALATHIPEGGGDIHDSLYIFHGQGYTIRNYVGAGDVDPPHSNLNGAICLNHRSWCQNNNWIVYSTAKEEIRACNGRFDIDVGRRLKSSDGSGVLDELTRSPSETEGWAFYSRDARQAWLGYASAAARTNDHIAVLDTKMGEPVPGESQEAYETRVRCLHWEITAPDTNDWFIAMAASDDDPVGMTKDGKLWTVNSGDSDLGSLPIDWELAAPLQTGGFPVGKKVWGSLYVRSLQKGSHNLNVGIRLDRNTSFSKEWSFAQLQAGTALWDTAVWDEALWPTEAVIRGFNQTNRYSDTIQQVFYNRNADEPVVITGWEQHYQMGAREA